MTKAQRKAASRFLGKIIETLRDRSYVQQPRAWPFHYEKLYRSLNSFEADKKAKGDKEMDLEPAYDCTDSFISVDTLSQIVDHKGHYYMPVGIPFKWDIEKAKLSL
jgi:hypothetical protein